jgi:hypothetical protein
MPRAARVVKGLTRAQIRAAYLAACQAELQALKPGKSMSSPRYGMSVADFNVRRGQRGALTHPALRWASASYRRAAEPACHRLQYQSLGILLLCAPMAAAAEGDGGPDLPAASPGARQARAEGRGGRVFRHRLQSAGSAKPAP